MKNWWWLEFHFAQAYILSCIFPPVRVCLTHLGSPSISRIYFDRCFRIYHLVLSISPVMQVNDYYDVRTKRSNIAMLFDKYGANRVRFFEGDLCDAPFISRIFEAEGIQWVVHMAARAGVRPSIEDPFVYVHSNVEATTRLLELARLHAVKSFVFASSSSVYGGSQNEVSEEAKMPTNRVF